jgi:hypothetical protein
LNCCINLYAEWGEKYLKNLILTSDDNEIFYNLDIIVNISFGLAQNLLNESDMQKNGYKPLETVMVIYFTDGSSAAYSAADCKISFDR